MSHPAPGHDYSEQHNRETNDEYRKRRAKAQGYVTKRPKASKLSGGSELEKRFGALSKALNNKK